MTDSLIAIAFSAGFLALYVLLPKGTDVKKLAVCASILMAFVGMCQIVFWVLDGIIRFFLL